MLHLLEDLRVVEVDFGVDLGYGGKLLADAGAAVTRIQIEGVRSDDLYVHHYFERGKTVVRSAGDFFQAVGALQEPADIYLIGIGGSAGRASNFSLERFSTLFPQSLAVLVTPFGWGAPNCFEEYDDITLQALGAVSLYIGDKGRPPLRLPFEQSMYQAGLVAAIAALSEWGVKDHGAVDLSIADIWASIYSGPEVTRTPFSRGKNGRGGFRSHGTPFPREIVRCKDGFFAVQAQNRRHWFALLEMVAQPELASLPLFQDRVRANNEHPEEADGYFAEFYQSRTKAELLELFIRFKVPGAPVLDVAEVLASEHLNFRGFFEPGPVAEQAGGEASRHEMHLPAAPYHVTSSRGPAPVARTTQGGSLPFSGLRVVDFGWVWAGAVPGFILAKLGAEVIKIEGRRRLDYMRQGKPIVGSEPDPEQNPMFQSVNGAKLSATIDFTSPEGAELIRELVAVSDVVIENFTPGVLAKHGLGWTELSQVNPRLVMCSMSPAGQDGPLRGLRTYATMIAGLSGMDSVVGYEGERVLGMQQSYPDPNASLHGVFGLIAALHRRRRDPDAGCYVDLSQWESGVALSGGALARYQRTNELPGTSGVWRENCAPIGNYPTAEDDVWVSLAVPNDDAWQRLLEALAPEWQREWFARTGPERFTDRRTIDELVSAETRRYPADELVQKLQSAGIAAARCLTTGELLGAAGFRWRELFQEVEHPILGPVSVSGLPWVRASVPRPSAKLAPTLGGDNAYVLSEVLKYSPQRVAELLQSQAMNA